MKIGNVLIVAICAATIFMLLGHPRKAEPPTAEKPRETPPVGAVADKTPPPIAEQRPAAQSPTETRAELYGRLADQPRFHLWGRIVQRLDNGNVLVEGTVKTLDGLENHTGVLALLPHKEPTSTADFASIDITAWSAGTYQYISVNGATQALHQFVQCPPGSASSTKPETLWKDNHNGLDRPR